MKTWELLVSFCQTLPSMHREKTSESRLCHLWTKIEKKSANRECLEILMFTLLPGWGAPPGATAAWLPPALTPFLSLPPSATHKQISWRFDKQWPLAPRSGHNLNHTRPQSLGRREGEMINQSITWLHLYKHHATAVVKADDGDDRAPFTVRCVLSLAAVERHRLTFEPGLQFVTWYSRVIVTAAGWVPNKPKNRPLIWRRKILLYD